jgi:hypothetical protein
VKSNLVAPATQQWSLPAPCRISFLAGKYFICGKKIFQVVASQELKPRPFDSLWNPFEKVGQLVYILFNYNYRDR